MNLSIVSGRNLRMSAMCPATAAATAMAGLARWVRAPGPCRPTKLRLVVETRPFARRDDVAVGAEAHGAAWLAPFEAGVEKLPMQALALRCALNRYGAGHDPGAHACGDLVAGQRRCRLAQIRQASVRARADEDPVDRRALNRIARPQPHITQGRLHALAAIGVGFVGRDRECGRRRRSRPAGWCPM